jgi:hypothetical protein
MVTDLSDETAAGGRHVAETFCNEILPAALDAYSINRSLEVARIVERAEGDSRLYRSLAIRGPHSIVDNLEKRRRRYRKKMRRRAARAKAEVQL